MILMKRIVIILFLFSISFSSFSQSRCAIERLEIYACKYDVFYSIYPSMDLIKEEGEYIRTSSFLHTSDSKLYSSLYNLEERPSEEVKALIRDSQGVKEARIKEIKEQTLFIYSIQRFSTDL